MCHMLPAERDTESLEQEKEHVFETASVLEYHFTF